MKNRFNLKNIISSILILSAIGIFASCSDWTDNENIGIKVPNIEDENKVLYQEYLENLRNYKKSDHPILLGWFDNSNKIPGSNAHHLTSLPDSVDIVSLLYPEQLADFELNEMKILQKDKATKVIFTIDIPAAEKVINAEIAEMDPEQMVEAFDTKLAAYLDQQLALLDTYPYDGVSLYYLGLATHFLPESEKEIIRNRQNIIFGKIEAAKVKHAQMLVLFEGKAVNVMDKTKLDLFDYIILRTFDAVSINDLALKVYSSIQGIPTENIIISASALSYRKDEEKVGVMPDVDGNESTAIVETAYWNPNSFKKAGVGIYRINDDYYNSDKDYKNTRKAIRILNPSPLN